MSDATAQPKERFAPKQAVTLNPPKDDIIDREYLAKCDGMHFGLCHAIPSRTNMTQGTRNDHPTLVGIKVLKIRYS